MLKINPNLHGTLIREIDILSLEDKFLDRLAEKAFAKVARIAENHVILDIGSIVDYNPAIANRVVRLALKEYAGTLDGYESKHFAAILRLISSRSGKKIDLPKHLCAYREYGNIIIGRDEKARSIDRKLDLSVKSVKVAGLRVNIDVSKKPGPVRTNRYEQVFDLDELSLPLNIRTRKEGDSVVIKSGRTKLKKVFQAEKVPYSLREAPILLCDRKGILWVLGIKRAYRALVNKNTKKVLVVNFEYTD